jgi:hypothetical protein
MSDVNDFLQDFGKGEDYCYTCGRRVIWTACDVCDNGHAPRADKVDPETLSPESKAWVNEHMPWVFTPGAKNPKFEALQAKLIANLPKRRTDYRGIK